MMLFLSKLMHGVNIIPIKIAETFLCVCAKSQTNSKIPVENEKDLE